VRTLSVRNLDVEASPQWQISAAVADQCITAEKCAPNIELKGRTAMRNCLTALSSLAFGLCLTAGSAFAQLAPPNEMGVTTGHWHFNSKDRDANRKILVAMGGVYQKYGMFDLVKFPGLIVFLNQGPMTPPPVGGSVGTVVNHVGFLVPNLQDVVAKLKAAGVDVMTGTNGRLDQAFVTTPDGVRIAIVEDKAQTVPIKPNHAHLFVPEAEIPKIQTWYVKYFGAKASKRGDNAAAELPGVSLFFARSATPVVGTHGHTLDHIGFDVKGLEAFMKKLEADGVKIDRPYRKDERTGVATGALTDPWGTGIELNERANPL
jgi:catechol 2,3-dioxygenase-like lactoylglutathione lyase family enzyme